MMLATSYDATLYESRLHIVVNDVASSARLGPCHSRRAPSEVLAAAAVAAAARAGVAADPVGGSGSTMYGLADIARHVNQRFSNRRSLNKVRFHDMASNTSQAQPRTPPAPARRRGSARSAP